MTRRLLLALLSLFLATSTARAQLKTFGDGGPGPVKAPHLTAELVSLAPSVAPGSSVDIGLVLALEEHWHVYWINAGDAGFPPSIQWTLPDGVTAGPMQFPVPSRIPLPPLMDFGYPDNTAFPVKISIAPTVKPGPIHLDAKVTWQVCREVCIVGKAHMGIDLTVDPSAQPGAQIGAVGAALKAIPEPLPADLHYTVTGGKSEFVLTLTGNTKPSADDVEYYPFDPDLIINASDQTYESIPHGFRLRVPRSPDLAALPTTFHGVLKLSDSEAYEVTAPVTPGETPVSVATKPSGSTALTALPAIGLAFLGGIILNLMPCVFPVLFLKGLALVQSSGDERKHMRSHGLAYTLGILVSFWTIVAVLLAVRATGQHIGWGFQLQSPAFIALLASFLFLFALSLAGQFDIGLSLTSTGDALARKEGLTGAFFTGVLATVVATPCTAPLMGAAIGFALSQSPVVTFAVFTALALGLALPYLLLTIQPAWTRILPRPGAWMETLKHITSVPLFATVIWLAWVYGRLHTGSAGTESDHLAYLLLCFLVLAIAGWVLGRWPAKWPASIVAAVLILLGLAIPLSQRIPSLVFDKEGHVSGIPPAQIDAAPYSQAEFDRWHSSGRPIFVDFTAAWCLSCQVNEKLVLQSREVQDSLAKHHVVLMRADWTQYSPDITAALTAVGRSGVPTYVIYPSKGNPNVLPELLTKEIVLSGIQSAGQ